MIPLTSGLVNSYLAARGDYFQPLAQERLKSFVCKGLEMVRKKDSF
jgi:hypothetical protein